MLEKLTSFECVYVGVNVIHSEGKTHLMEMVKRKLEGKTKFQKYRVYKKKLIDDIYRRVYTVEWINLPV